MNVSPVHPLGEAATLVAGIALVVLPLALAVWAAVEIGVRFLPAGLEARWFADLAPDAALGGDPRREMVEALVGRLARHWEGNPYAFRAGVLPEDAPNAFALPGGVIVVTSGLLDGVGSENELAFVLGHELGHFRHRDHLRALGRQTFLAVVWAALATGGVGSTLPQTVSSLAERGFSRDQERAADAFGLALLHAEYGHVAGAGGFFTRLPDAEGGVGARLSSWVATHPMSAERLDALHDTARAAVYAEEGTQTPLPATWREAAQ